MINVHGDGADKQMIDTAGSVADFAYRQGVGDATAVDALIQKYRAARATLRLIAHNDGGWCGDQARAVLHPTSEDVA